MKRQYNKPELFFEEYELTEAIASNCGNEAYRGYTNYNTYHTCSVDMGTGEDFLFITGNNRCNTLPGGEDDYFCYESFGNQAMVFNS